MQRLKVDLIGLIKDIQFHWLLFSCEGGSLEATLLLYLSQVWIWLGYEQPRIPMLRFSLVTSRIQNKAKRYELPCRQYKSSMNEVDVLKQCDKANDVVVRKCQKWAIWLAPQRRWKAWLQGGKERSEWWWKIVQHYEADSVTKCCMNLATVHAAAYHVAKEYNWSWSSESTKHDRSIKI